MMVKIDPKALKPSLLTPIDHAVFKVEMLDLVHNAMQILHPMQCLHHHTTGHSVMT